MRVGDEVFGDANDINVHNDVAYFAYAGAGVGSGATRGAASVAHDIDFMASTRVKFRILELLSKFSYS